jgi:hypothetical protein
LIFFANLLALRRVRGVIFFLIYSLVVKLIGLPSSAAVTVINVGAAVLIQERSSDTRPGRLIANTDSHTSWRLVYFTTKWWLTRRDLLKDDNRLLRSIKPSSIRRRNGHSPAEPCHILATLGDFRELTFV